MIDRIENPNALFFLQIISSDEVIARFNGGGKIETEIIDTLTEKIDEKLAFYNTPKKRKQLIAENIREFISELKKKTVKIT